MPFSTEHACRLKDPDLFDKGSIYRQIRHHNGKEYSVIVGKISGKQTDQAYRYKTDLWSKGEAMDHCKSHNGILFEPAKQ